MHGHARAFNVPLKAPFRIATGVVETAQNVLFELEHDGTAGVGEAAPFKVITGNDQTSTLAALGGLADEPQRVTDDAGEILDAWNGTGLPSDARNALDVALHDWAARRRGLSLARLLGGVPRAFETSVTIPIVPLDRVAAVVERGLEAGFRVFKIKSKGGVEEEAERFRLVRDAAGADAELRVDANAGWTLQETRQLVPALRAADIAFLEQPLLRDDLEGHAALVRDGAIPIMADESVFTLADARRVVDGKAADLINVKLAKAGGLREAGRILDFAEEHGIDCMVGCMIESRIGIGAGAHLASAYPAVRYVDLDGFTFLAEDPVEGGVAIRDGKLVIPDEPGHGAQAAETATAAPA